MGDWNVQTDPGMMGRGQLGYGMMSGDQFGGMIYHFAHTQ